jgi:hypothetical protein
VREPVENRLPHPVGRGAQAGCIDDRERGPLPLASDDPDSRGSACKPPARTRRAL